MRNLNFPDELFYFLSDKFEFAGNYFSSEQINQLESKLKMASIDKSSPEYLSFAMGIAVVIALALEVILFYYYKDISSLGFIAFALVFYAVVNYPKKKAQRIAAAIDKELPSFLRSVQLNLRAGMPFERAVSQYSETFPLIHNEMKRFKKTANKSKSIEDIFSQISLSTASTELKRALSYLSDYYKKGTGEEHMRALSLEASKKLSIKLEKYTSKVALYMLMLVMVSAILPAMIQAFLIIGSLFMDISVSPSLFLILGAVVFPLLDIVVIMLIIGAKP